ncbi:MAG: tRNA (cmo5U34)-methyltransferase [Chloroflexota bacterium]|jgi:ubiquinone/menaquinone biosynthesis C-methylase UbiE|nr:tRNA (cmo5U34)-methyltransferase [Chloroflexota bacterium]
MQQLTGQAYVERYGHEWFSLETARAYVARTDQEGDDRADAFRVMASLVPFNPSDSFRILDIGSGQGVVAQVVLDAFPSSSALAIDVSEPMMTIAQERMARYGKRFDYVLGDFIDGGLPGAEGTFDVIVSSKAIHHLKPPQKQQLFTTIYQALNPGGVFFNLDTVAPADDVLRARYRAAGRVLRGLPAEETAGVNRAPTGGHYYITAAEHLQFLRNAGFPTVDVFWKRLGVSLIGGYKGA